MSIIQFAGFTQEQINAMMPDLVEILGLGHPVYSAQPTPAVNLYDGDGKFQGIGQMIIVPGFEAVRSNPSLLSDLAQRFGVPVTCTVAEVKLATGKNLF